VCSACHGPQAQGNLQLNAPKLAGQPGWYLARQLRGFKHGLRGADSRDVYAQQMAPMAATLADEAAIRNVVAYIGTLGDPPAAATVHGDAERGKELYTTCGACHGMAGEGIWATNAPRLAHMSDWYLARQIKNFQQGIRGAHPQDFAGVQMGQMAGVLRDDRAISDLLAYVNGL
jgi:cytochrome c oxidase subunit 2